LFLLFGAKKSNRIAAQTLHREHRIGEQPAARQFLSNDAQIARLDFCSNAAEFLRQPVR
jgi:hypothetical protein